MNKDKLSGGLVHKLPGDLIVALTETDKIISLWEGLSPIARNEFICWVENAKQEETRSRRIKRTVEELLEDKRRVGCIHRTDKKPSKWQQAVLIDKKITTLMWLFLVTDEVCRQIPARLAVI